MNEWWSSETGEGFWMETIRRPEHGDGIRAPETKSDGSSWPYYELVRHVSDGDVVLHWDTNAKPSAFVGYSFVDGEAYATDEVVYSDGAPTSGYEALLRDYVTLDSPLTLDAINSRADELTSVRDALVDEYGKTIYFPFAIWSSGTVRPMQGGYLTKFPRALFDVLPELAAAKDAFDAAPAERGEVDVVVGGDSRTMRRQAREAGYSNDPQVRKAIEERAVLVATTHYEADYEVKDVGATESFDLLLTHNVSEEVRHVEVKGSTGLAEAVELTIGEVNHAAGSVPTDLFVVSDIMWHREDGGVVAEGGKAQLFADWVPEDFALAPTRFRYTVPTSGGKSLK